MAKSSREIYNDIEKHESKEEYRRIKKLTTLQPDELWEISDENFYKWIKMHYYPNLLQHFRDNLALFEQWQRIWNLTDERILELGITSCIESKGDKKNIYKYLIERTSYQGVQKFVSNINLDGKVEHGGPYFTYAYKLIEGFVSYFDWFKFQCVPQKERVIHNEILRYASKSSLNTDDIQIMLQDKFRLLKMGGITLSGNHLRILKVKNIEFANLSRLMFTGKIGTQNKILSISNSYVDDLIVSDCELFQVTFYKCEIMNLKIYNSNINTWNFIDCKVSGEIVNSELTYVSIRGGAFDVFFKDCKLFDVGATHYNSNLYFLSAYRNLKQAFRNQGEDALEQMYYLKEKEYIRKGIISQNFQNIRENNRLLLKNKQTVKSLMRFAMAQFSLSKAVLSYIFKTVNFYYWGYGLKPFNVLKSSIVLICLFALIYFIQLTQLSFLQMDLNNILESIKISLSSFSTLGYFSDGLDNVSESLVILESVIGGLSIGAFIASASNMKF